MSLEKDILSKYKYIHHIYLNNANMISESLREKVPLIVEKFQIIYVNNTFIYYKKPGCDSLVYIRTSNAINANAYKEFAYNIQNIQIRPVCKDALKNNKPINFFFVGSEKYIPEIVEDIKESISKCATQLNDDIVVKYLEERKNKVERYKRQYEEELNKYESEMALLKLKLSNATLSEKEMKNIIDRL